MLLTSVGGNLTIFNKDHDNAEEGRSRILYVRQKVLAAKHTASLQLLCTVDGNQARSDARTECKILELSLRGTHRRTKGNVNESDGPPC